MSATDDAMLALIRQVQGREAQMVMAALWDLVCYIKPTNLRKRECYNYVAGNLGREKMDGGKGTHVPGGVRAGGAVGHDVRRGSQPIEGGGG